ncbi:MAG TPA: cyclodeaminase/cyclohydrolase family protein [Ignavibacteriaceae bacterium]|jgi:formiminotetrahydrofolate cyclodeaminase|nr:cyclodeaminase/cyclohydrolase family protein [Ignavibacteriaceae bacterium]
MNLDDSIRNYLDDISSSNPTPGGGNVSAFSGAMACSLGIMVCSLTIGKKKYAEVEEEMKDIKFELSVAKEEFLNLAEKDNQAFEKVMNSFKLPKDTDEQKKTRSESIEAGTLEAAEAPSEVLHYCGKIIPLFQTLAEKGNQNSVSDAGVAAALISTAAEGAYLNVLINCFSLSNQTVAGEILKKNEIILSEVTQLSQFISSEIKRKLHK